MPEGWSLQGACFMHEGLGDRCRTIPADGCASAPLPGFLEWQPNISLNNFSGTRDLWM